MGADAMSHDNGQKIIWREIEHGQEVIHSARGKLREVKDGLVYFDGLMGLIIVPCESLVAVK